MGDHWCVTQLNCCDFSLCEKLLFLPPDSFIGFGRLGFCLMNLLKKFRLSHHHQQELSQHSMQKPFSFANLVYFDLALKEFNCFGKSKEFI